MWYRDLTWVLNALPKEPELSHTLGEICRVVRPRVFWDVGANIGGVSWMVAAQTSLSRAVLFEPLPANIRLLKSTLALNRFHNMRLVEAAVASGTGETEFVVDDLSGATSQIKEIFNGNGEHSIARSYGLKKSIRVKVTTLDDLLKEGEPIPDLIKMDVEGAELMALKGAENLLARAETIIVFECHELATIGHLSDRGFDIYRIDALQNYLAVPKNIATRLSSVTTTLRGV